MTTAADRSPAAERDVKLWLQMYRQMMAIRLFEEQVNDLYMRALMPGLAHLYIGEEAVAAGVCDQSIGFSRENRGLRGISASAGRPPGRHSLDCPRRLTGRQAGCGT